MNINWKPEIDQLRLQLLNASTQLDEVRRELEGTRALVDRLARMVVVNPAIRRAANAASPELT